MSHHLDEYHMSLMIGPRGPTIRLGSGGDASKQDSHVDGEQPHFHQIPLNGFAM
jgi:hypothetical protein